MGLLGVVVIDKLILEIPFKEEFLIGDYETNSVLRPDALRAAGVKLGSRSVAFTAPGVFEVDDLYHPFESLPSSFDSMAVKVYDKPVNQIPHVMLKCSPAKLMQGHNVYGSDDPFLGGSEMIALLSQAMPELYEMLDVPLTELAEIDCTFSARFETQYLCDQVIQALSNISKGQTKSRQGYATTAYFGAASSRLKKLKVYSKLQELLERLKEYKRGNQDGSNDHLISANTEVLEFAKGMARFEATIKRRYLRRRGIPTGFFRFCKYDSDYLAANGRRLSEHLFELAFADVLKALEGADMTTYSDEEIFDQLKAEFHTVSEKTGKVSYTQANAAFRTFRGIRSEGWDEVKRTTSKATFYRHIKMLYEIGCSRAWLQNLTNNTSNVVPLVRAINIDFSKQVPDGWSEPVSQFDERFIEPRSHLRLVG